MKQIQWTIFNEKGVTASQLHIFLQLNAKKRLHRTLFSLYASSITFTCSGQNLLVRQKVYGGYYHGNVYRNITVSENVTYLLFNNVK